MKKEELKYEITETQNESETDDIESANTDKKKWIIRGLIGVVIVIVILLLGFGLRGNNVDAVMDTLSTEEAKDIITDAFLTSIGDYVDGDISTEEMKVIIGDMINDYLEASGGFTQTQIEALNEYIANYLQESTIYTDIEKNEKAINDLSTLINEKYQDNRNYITNVESQLTELINSNQVTDDERYKELKKMDEQLKQWLDDTEGDLTTMINDLETLFKNTIGGTTYDASKTYEQGDFVFYQGCMYVSLISDNKEALTNKEAWAKTDIKTLMSDMDTKYETALGAVRYSSTETYKMGDYVFDDKGNFYISLVDDNTGNDLSDTNAWKLTDIQTIFENLDKKFTDALGSERYVAGNTYNEGNFVFDDNGTLYVSLIDNNAADLSDANAWKQTDVETALNDLNKTLQDVINSVIGAGEYVENNTYKNGDYVIYEGNLYVYKGADGTNAPITDTSSWENSSINQIINNMSNDLVEITLKQSSDLTEVKNNLTTIINENAELTEEQRKEMLDIIDKQEESTQESLDDLLDELLKVVENSDAADSELSNQLGALKDATAGDIADLNKLLEQYVTEINQTIADTKSELETVIAELQDAATWSDSVTYDKNAYITYYSKTSGVQRFYHSLADNNLNHEPGTEDGASWWEEIDTVALINDLQSQVTDNKNHLLDKNGSGNEFQYGISNGSHGYYVNGTFKSF